jgi:hypothetical protein
MQRRMLRVKMNNETRRTTKKVVVACFQGLPGRLRPRIFLTFGITRVVGRQPYAPAAFTLGEIPGNHFQRLSRPQGTWFRRGGGGEGKNPQ